MRDAEPRELRIGPRDELGLFGGYHSPQLEVDVRLNTNEAPEPPPAAWLEDVARGLSHIAFNRYPDRDATALRAAIGAVHGLGPERVFAANGSNEVLQALLLAYGGPDRRVAVFEPTYALHSHIARVTGTTVRAGERDADFLVSPGVLATVLEDGPAITFLCSPNNPTGRLETREVLEAALAGAPGLVVVDEAYGQFAPWSAAELLDGHRHLVVVRTFSKTWSLAGLRLGYALADPAVVAACQEVALPYHLDALKQMAGIAALSYGEEMAARVGRLTTERTRVVAGLRSLGLFVVPSDANFVLFHSGSDDARGVWERLVARSVLVRDVSSWPRLGGYLRVTIGTARENDAFLDALRKVL